MMVILVILGMFLDWVGILLLAVPIFIPLMKALSFDGVFGFDGVSPKTCRCGLALSTWSICKCRF